MEDNTMSETAGYIYILTKPFFASKLYTFTLFPFTLENNAHYKSSF